MMKLMACVVRQDVAPLVLEFYPEHHVPPSPMIVSDDERDTEPVRDRMGTEEAIPPQTGGGAETGRASTIVVGSARPNLHLRDEHIDESP